MRQIFRPTSMSTHTNLTTTKSRECSCLPGKPYFQIFSHKILPCRKVQKFSTLLHSLHKDNHLQLKPLESAAYTVRPICRLILAGGLTSPPLCNLYRAAVCKSHGCCPRCPAELPKTVSPLGTTIPAASLLGATLWQGCDGGFKRHHTSGGESRRGRDEPGLLRPLQCNVGRNKTAITETTTKATQSVL